MSKIQKQIANQILKFARLIIGNKKEFPDIMSIRTWKYYKENPNQTILYDFPLDQNSVVFDVGGYKGEYTKNIINRYNSNVYIFEPHPNFFKEAQTRFLDNPKVKIYNLGLSGEAGQFLLTDDNLGSSMVKSSYNNEAFSINVVDITSFLLENKIYYIDLIKINIEGAEYSLLNKLLMTGDINKIKFILVQFHELNQDSNREMVKIQLQLQKTHVQIFEYPFVWEMWKLKE